LRMNHEIKIKGLALRSKSFHSEKVEDPNLLYSCFLSMSGLGSI